MAKTLSVMRGRPFAEEAYRSTLHAFKWVTNHADCYEYLKHLFQRHGATMDKFAAENAPLQAWIGQCTWVPLFDQAARFQIHRLRECQRAQLVSEASVPAAACIAE